MRCCVCAAKKKLGGLIKKKLRRQYKKKLGGLIKKKLRRQYKKS
jgi:hypothetical protein